MAVVQISRIQIRRGQKNTSSGLPQLASGELAWAIDTQELYIGNGAVSEGAPYVGNTKILTEQDNLLELVGTYQFAKNNSAIQTGPNANQPIVQNLQEVIDQFVTASYFGVVGDGVEDNTAAIQRAIDQLFLNPASQGIPANPGAREESRVELMFGPGIYRITSTIYLPSYCYITGSGSQHTIFLYEGDDLAFKFVNTDSAIGEYTTANVTPTNQPKYAILRDFTISCSSSLASGIELNCVSNSKFENLNVVGAYPWDATDYVVTTNVNKTGIVLLGGLKDANNDTLPTTELNLFNKVSVSGFAVCVRGDQNVAYNNFTNCDFSYAFYGMYLGFGVGGPFDNTISSSSFRHINKQGIYLEDGTGNISSNNKFEDVGADGGHLNVNSYSIIYFGSKGNQTVGDTFDRGPLATELLGNTYKPEVDGITYFVNSGPQEAQITQVLSTPINLIRIPVTSSGCYEISYKYFSTTQSNQFRKGTMSITVDITNGNFEFVEEFDLLSNLGNIQNENTGSFQSLKFSAAISGNSIIIKYTNQLSGNGKIRFVISAIT